MLESLPKPKDSVIQEKDLGNGTHFYWRPQNAAGAMTRTIPRVIMLLFMLGWATAEYRTIQQLFHTNPNSTGGALSTVFMVVWLTGWTIGGLFCAVITLVLFAPEKDESVTLQDTRFLYHPGQITLIVKPGEERKSQPPLAERKLRSRKIKLDRSEITEFGYEEIQDETRLFVVHAQEKIEIGRYLEPADREWLYVVLEEWRMR